MLQVCSLCCHLLPFSRLLALALSLCPLCPVPNSFATLLAPLIVNRLLQPARPHRRQHFPQTRHLDPQSVQPQLRLRLAPRLARVPQRRSQWARERVGRRWSEDGGRRAGLAEEEDGLSEDELDFLGSAKRSEHSERSAGRKGGRPRPVEIRSGKRGRGERARVEERGREERGEGARGQLDIK